MQSLAEQLMFVTVRLEGRTLNGTSTGTGFFFQYNNHLFLITNKHVIKDVTAGTFSVLQATSTLDEKEPILGSSVPISFSETNFSGHPDPEIDITVADVTSTVISLMNSGSPLYYKNVDERLIPKKEDYEKFIGPMEEIVFIGYPSGIYDSKNNLPVIRRGITASPCYYDFEGKKTFLIDASVFPGSSGSPVFIYYAGTYPDKAGKAYLGNRLYFLGIIARVYQRQEKGVIKVIDIPTTQALGVEVEQMIDLGIVFKASSIIETIDNYLKVKAIGVSGGHSA